MRGVQRRWLWLKLALGVLCTCPALDLIRVLSQMNRHFITAYDNRVFRVAIEASGAWAFIFLFIVLACTPVQRLTGWAWVRAVRRLLGLFAFFYVVLHFAAYFVVGQKFHFDYLMFDALQAKSRIPGWLALLLLIPLALSSTDGMVRRIGARRWKWLHRLVYPAVALALWHLAWTEVDHGSTDFHETRTALIPFVLVLLARLVPSSWFRRSQARP